MNIWSYAPKTPKNPLHYSNWKLHLWLHNEAIKSPQNYAASFMFSDKMACNTCFDLRRKEVCQVHFSYRRIYSCDILKRMLAELQAAKYKNRQKIRVGMGWGFLFGCLIWFAFFWGPQFLTSFLCKKKLDKILWVWICTGSSDHSEFLKMF